MKKVLFRLHLSNIIATQKLHENIDWLQTIWTSERKFLINFSRATKSLLTFSSSLLLMLDTFHDADEYTQMLMCTYELQNKYIQFWFCFAEWQQKIWFMRFNRSEIQLTFILTLTIWLQYSIIISPEWNKLIKFFSFSLLLFLLSRLFILNDDYDDFIYTFFTLTDSLLLGN